MEDNRTKFLNSRPQRLCHMCGKCCKVAVTPKTYDELKNLADSGDEGASEFLKVFEPYTSIEEAKKVSKETVENILNALEETKEFDEKAFTFYKCKYVMDNNLCGIYQNRPPLCDAFPASPWAVVPPGCGFEGWLFQKREEVKQKIRKFKEEILSLEITKKELQSQDQIKKVEEMIQKLNKTISLYEKYGSKDW